MLRLDGLTEQEQGSPGEFRGNLSAVCLRATNRTVITHSFSHHDEHVPKGKTVLETWEPQSKE